jgi:ribosomal protein S18 acetylase RimI-like enzyme
MKVRVARLSDARAVGALYIQLQDHHHELQPHNPRYQVAPERWLEIARAAIEHSDDEVLVAEEERKVVGLARLRYEEKPWGLACQIETLVVDSEWRGRGAGTKLLQASEDAAARRGALGMRVEVVVESDAGRYFYENRGYRSLALRYGKPVEGAGPPLPSI